MIVSKKYVIFPMLVFIVFLYGYLARDITRSCYHKSYPNIQSFYQDSNPSLSLQNNMPIVFRPFIGSFADDKFVETSIDIISRLFFLNIRIGEPKGFTTLEAVIGRKTIKTEYDQDGNRVILGRCVRG